MNTVISPVILTLLVSPQINKPKHDMVRLNMGDQGGLGGPLYLSTAQHTCYTCCSGLWGSGGVRAVHGRPGGWPSFVALCPVACLHRLDPCTLLFSVKPAHPALLAQPIPLAWPRRTSGSNFQAEYYTVVGAEGLESDVNA